MTSCVILTIQVKLYFMVYEHELWVTFLTHYWPLTDSCRCHQWHRAQRKVANRGVTYVFLDSVHTFYLLKFILITIINGKKEKQCYSRDCPKYPKWTFISFVRGRFSGLNFRWVNFFFSLFSFQPNFSFLDK